MNSSVLCVWPPTIPHNLPLYSAITLTGARLVPASFGIILMTVTIAFSRFIRAIFWSVYKISSTWLIVRLQIYRLWLTHLKENWGTDMIVRKTEDAVRGMKEDVALSVKVSRHEALSRGAAGREDDDGDESRDHLAGRRQGSRSLPRGNTLSTGSRTLSWYSDVLGIQMQQRRHGAGRGTSQSQATRSLTTTTRSSADGRDGQGNLGPGGEGSGVRIFTTPPTPIVVASPGEGATGDIIGDATGLGRAPGDMV